MWRHLSSNTQYCKCAIQTVHMHHTKSVKRCGRGVDTLMGLNIPKQALHHIPGWPEMLGIAPPSTDDVRGEKEVGKMQTEFKLGKIPPVEVAFNLWAWHQIGCSISSIEKIQVTLNTQGQLGEPALFFSIHHILYVPSKLDWSLIWDISHIQFLPNN